MKSMTLSQALDVVYAEFSQFELERARWKAEKDILVARNNELKAELSISKATEIRLMQEIKALESALLSERGKNKKEEPPSDTPALPRGHLTSKYSIESRNIQLHMSKLQSAYKKSRATLSSLAKDAIDAVKGIKEPVGLVISTEPIESHEEQPPIPDIEKKEPTSVPSPDNTGENMKMNGLLLKEKEIRMKQKSMSSPDTLDQTKDSSIKQVIEPIQSILPDAGSTSAPSSFPSSSSSISDADQREDITKTPPPMLPQSSEPEQLPIHSVPQTESLSLTGTAVSHQLDQTIHTRKLNTCAHFKGHYSSVRAVEWVDAQPSVSSSPYLLTGGDDGVVRLWGTTSSTLQPHNVKTFSEFIFSFRGHSSPVLSLSVSPLDSYTNKRFITGDVDGVVNVWEIPSVPRPYCPYIKHTRAHVSRMKFHSDAVWGVVSHPTMPFGCSVSCDCTMALFSLHRQEERESSKGPLLSSTTLAVPSYGMKGLTPSSLSIVGEASNSMCVGCVCDSLCETGGNVLQVDAKSGRLSVTNAPTVGDITKPVSVYDVCKGYEDESAVCACSDKTVKLIDFRTKKHQQSFPLLPGIPTCVSIDSGGRYYVVGCADKCGSVCVIDSRYSNRIVCVAELHNRNWDEGVTALKIRPDSLNIASAGADGVVTISQLSQ
ncbi:striatin-3 [Aduncisulcus paluster]|uniref:Striatin-3 n=1 Tax=Aduncisulcus paluster TaxID=2918883 RepID=A0ABQ5KPM7_9EUKA|nr:striatin-3 [Aduncisulcus paluster]